VVVLADSPLHTEVLEPRRVADAISESTREYDFVVVDMHPDYGPLNQVIFERADKIIVPVTPDVPAIRAAVQFREVAVELEIRERLAMVVNRANSGVSVADMERTVGMPALAEVRSAGMLFVRAANEGRTVIEMFPREKVSEDFDALADRLLGAKRAEPVVKTPFRLFNRATKEPARA
jgi:pilus assembly protein CpaE